jgi:hypothetical protein
MVRASLLAVRKALTVGAAAATRHGAAATAPLGPVEILLLAVVGTAAVVAIAMFGCAQCAKKPRRQNNNNAYYYGQGYPPPPAGAYGYPAQGAGGRPGRSGLG